MVQLHTLTKSPARKTKRRIGRGGKRGKTSGHGHKGQKQHGRHGIRPALRDMLKKLPKRRGYGKNRARTVNSARITHTPVNLSQLESVFSDGDTVSPATLVAQGVVSTRSGRVPAVKILGRGKLTKRVTVEKCATSASARAAIENAGGTVVVRNQ